MSGGSASLTFRRFCVLDLFEMNAPRSTELAGGARSADRAEACDGFSDDARAARAARRLRTLEELAEIGMEVARVLQRRVLDEAARDADGDQPADAALGLAFTRVSRAVRQTLALEDKLDRPPRAPVLSPEAERAAWLADLKASPEIAALSVMVRKDEVRAKVERTIASEADGSDSERLLADLEERLDDAEAGEDFFDRPIGEMVAAICRDLGVTRDWNLWENEDWAMEEARAKPLGSPYARRRKVWPHAAWPDGVASGYHPP
jgi:hypothetical protein